MSEYWSSKTFVPPLQGAPVSYTDYVFTVVIRTFFCTSMESHSCNYCMDQTGRLAFEIILKCTPSVLSFFYPIFPNFKHSSARSKDLVSCRHLLHIWGSRSLCVMVSSALPSFQVRSFILFSKYINFYI